MTDITRKRNDTTPETGTLTVNGIPADLSQASAVRFRMRETDSDGELVVDGSATIVDETGGVVRYTFEAGEVDTSGFYVAEWEVEYADASKKSFPDAGLLSVRLTDDLA